MEDTQSVHTPAGGRPTEDKPQRWRSALKVTAIVFFILVCAVSGVALSLLGKFYGTNPLNALGKLKNLQQAIVDPQQVFPNQSHITVLCLGLDRNIVISKNPKENGMPSTKKSRSDVMMVASLDLEKRTVSILSIPRDTRVKLPGKRSFSKINQAHADGGIEYTRKAVEEFLGVPIDYHVVIKQEAIQGVIDAMSGLDLNVEGALINGKRVEMNYDDNWGQLHIHLAPGQQKLTGEQVVGYMRFRHDAEGDLGRIRRQQQVIQTLADRAKDPTIIFKAPAVIDQIEKHVNTDLSKDQQVALAQMFHKTDTANLQTVAMPVAETTTINRVSYVIPDEYRLAAAVDWIIKGDRDAMNRLIRVELRNASGDRELYNRTYDCLRHFGFEVVRRGRADEELTTSRIVQHSKMRGSARRVLEVLGLGGNVEKEEDPGADVTLYVGKDLETNQVIAGSEWWPEMPQRRVQASYSSTRSRGRRGADYAPVSVRVRASEDAEETAPAPDAAADTQPDAAPAPTGGTESAPLDVPGTADPPPAAPSSAPAAAPAASPVAPAPASTLPAGRRSSVDEPDTEVR